MPPDSTGAARAWITGCSVHKIFEPAQSDVTRCNTNQEKRHPATARGRRGPGCAPRPNWMGRTKPVQPDVTRCNMKRETVPASVANHPDPLYPFERRTKKPNRAQQPMKKPYEPKKWGYGYRLPIKACNAKIRRRSTLGSTRQPPVPTP